MTTNITIYSLVLITVSTNNNIHLTGLPLLSSAFALVFCSELKLNITRGFVYGLFIIISMWFWPQDTSTPQFHWVNCSLICPRLSVQKIKQNSTSKYLGYSPETDPYTVILMQPNNETMQATVVRCCESVCTSAGFAVFFIWAVVFVSRSLWLPHSHVLKLVSSLRNVCIDHVYSGDKEI